MTPLERALMNATPDADGISSVALALPGLSLIVRLRSETFIQAYVVYDPKNGDKTWEYRLLYWRDVAGLEGWS